MEVLPDIYNKALYMSVRVHILAEVSLKNFDGIPSRPYQRPCMDLILVIVEVYTPLVMMLISDIVCEETYSLQKPHFVWSWYL